MASVARERAARISQLLEQSFGLIHEWFLL